MLGAVLGPRVSSKHCLHSAHHAELLARKAPPLLPHIQAAPGSAPLTESGRRAASLQGSQWMLRRHRTCKGVRWPPRVGPMRMPTEKEDMVTPKAGALLWDWITSAMDDMAIDTELNAVFRICRHQPGLETAQALMEAAGAAREPCRGASLLSKLALLLRVALDLHGGKPGAHHDREVVVQAEVVLDMEGEDDDRQARKDEAEHQEGPPPVCIAPASHQRGQHGQQNLRVHVLLRACRLPALVLSSAAAGPWMPQARPWIG